MPFADRSAKAKLQEVLKLLAQQPLQQPLDTVPVLCMLTHVLLQLGTLVDAHTYAVQVCGAGKVVACMLEGQEMLIRPPPVRMQSGCGICRTAAWAVFKDEPGLASF